MTMYTRTSGPDDDARLGRGRSGLRGAAAGRGPERVEGEGRRDDAERAKRHGQRGDLGRQPHAEDREERTGAKVAREIWIAASTSASAFRTRTTSAASTARLVPQPMATPTSAWASAGPSFTPSPTIMTTRPSPCSRATTAALLSGRTRANASGMPHFLATAAAHRSVSP